jgi:hypothetical protein
MRGCFFLAIGSFFQTGWRLVFSLGRFHRATRYFTGRNNRNNVSDFARGVTSGSQGLSPCYRRFVIGNLHDPHIVRKDTRRFIVRRHVLLPRFFGLDNPLHLDDFPACGIGTADILTLELRIQLITLLASRTNDVDVHAMGSIQGRKIVLGGYFKTSSGQFILDFSSLPINRWLGLPIAQSCRFQKFIR